MIADATGPNPTGRLVRTGEAGTRLAVIVLAGGQSSRFGSDKLQADLGDGRTLLAHALAALPAAALVAVVGPERDLDRTVSFLREDPPGGGPAAALIAGLTWALETGAAVIATLPGDMPSGGQAVALLLTALVDGPGPSGPGGAAQRLDTSARPGTLDISAGPSVAVAVDSTGRDQVLQLALNPAGARALITAAGAGRGAGQSARRLLQAAAVDLVRVPLAPKLTADIDTVAQLRIFAEHQDIR